MHRILSQFLFFLINISPLVNCRFLYEYHLLNKVHDNKPLCPIDSKLKFLDYTLRFNSYVAICQEKSGDLEIQIARIDPQNENQLSIDSKASSKIFDAAKTYEFALDWLHGLLYFTNYDIIGVIDLKKKQLSTFNIYQRSRKVNHITSLMVWPESLKLFWIEQSDDLSVALIESSQNGEIWKISHELDGVGYSQIAYEPRNDYYMFLNVQTELGRRGRIVSGKNFSEGCTFQIAKKGWKINNVKLFNNSLIFDAYSQDPFQKLLLAYDFQTECEKLIYDQSNPLIPVDWKTLEKLDRNLSTFAIYDPEIRDEFNRIDRCENVLCARTEKDFCLPVNQTYSQCTSGEYLKLPEQNSKLIIIIIIIFAVIIVISLCYFIFIHKQRARFYQIRLKKINRVESSKLPEKPPATEEIAD